MEAYPRAYVPRNEPNLGPDEENLYRGERRRSPQSERFNEQQSEDDHDDNVSYRQENQDRLSSRGESPRADIDSLSGLSGMLSAFCPHNGARIFAKYPLDLCLSSGENTQHFQGKNTLLICQTMVVDFCYHRQPISKPKGGRHLLIPVGPDRFHHRGRFTRLRPSTGKPFPLRSSLLARNVTRKRSIRNFYP